MPENNTSTPSIALPGIARALVASGKLPVAKAEALYASSIKNKNSFIGELVARGAVSGSDVATIISSVYGAPLIDLDAIDIDRLPSGLLDAKLAVANKIIPLAKRGNRLVVATSDPTDHSVVEQIKFATQLSVDWVVAEHARLLKTLEAIAKQNGESVQDIMGDVNLNEFEISDVQEGGTSSNAEETDVDDAPIVKFLQKMLIDAFNMRASDLHFEPYEHNYRIRYRIDGELREIASPPTGIKDKLATMNELLGQLGLQPEEAGFMGDDIIDLKVMAACGFAAAPADAQELAKHYADLISSKAGGRGAVREVCEFILEAQGKLDAVEKNSTFRSK